MPQGDWFVQAFPILIDYTFTQMSMYNHVQEWLMQLSIALSKAGDNKTAHQNLQQVLKETPETIQTLLWLARATADE